VSQFAGGASARRSSGSDRAAILSGIGVGVAQAATPLVFWWLDTAIVYALGLAAIAAIYVGFAVGDGRVRIIAVESSVALTFVVVAAAVVVGALIAALTIVHRHRENVGRLLAGTERRVWERS